MNQLSPKRKGRVTGSAVGAILGLSPFSTADDVLRRMVREYHGADSEFTGNVATEYGSFHERGAIQDFEMQTGQHVEPCGFYEVGDWLGATPDGLIGDSGLIEVKCPYGLRDSKPPIFKTTADQPHYMAQMQIELLCTNRHYVKFCQWAPHGCLIETILRDDAWIAETLPVLKSFHERYLSEVDNPEHLLPRRKVIESDAASKLLAEHDELAQAIDRADERKREVLAELVAMADQKDATICGRKLTCVQKEGAVSYAKLVKAVMPDVDVEPYRGKASEYWRLG